MEDYAHAFDNTVTGEDKSKKVNRLNQILDDSLAVAAESGRLDLTNFIIYCFRVEPNDEHGTVDLLRKSNLLSVIPGLKNKEVFRKLFTLEEDKKTGGVKNGISMLVKLPNSTSEEDGAESIDEVEVIINTGELLNAGNHSHGIVGATPLTKGSVFNSANTIIGLL